VDWDVLDFVVFGALIAAVAVTYRLAMRWTGDSAYRFAVGVALAGAFLLVWVNGAVGIIGASGNDANMMFFGVLGIGVIGAFMGRFQAHGMARALCATALAQVLDGVIASQVAWVLTVPPGPGISFLPPGSSSGCGCCPPGYFGRQGRRVNG
jgi:hypothetical protein